MGAGRLRVGEATEDINRAAAAIAREACEEFSTPGRPRWVVGSIGPGTRSPTLSQGKDLESTNDFIDVATMEDGYRRQVRGLLEGGADVVLVETCFDLLQVKAAVAACNDVFVERGTRVPLMVQFTVEADINTMLLGTEPAAAIAALDPLAIDVLGINCATGPADMREHVRTLSRSSRLAISVIPNAGMPTMVDGATCYPLDPAGLAAAQAEFVSRFGVSIVGGCCGTTPEHLGALVDAVDGLAPAPRLLAGRTASLPSTRRRPTQLSAEVLAEGRQPIQVAGGAEPAEAAGTHGAIRVEFEPSLGPPW